MSTSIALMLAIESLSPRTNAHVAQIGYCVADLESGDVIQSPTVLSLDPHAQKDRCIDFETAVWWMKQDKRAVEFVFGARQDRLTPEQAFDVLRADLNKHGVSSVWANQSSEALATLAELWNGERPWPSGAERELGVL